MNTGFLASLLAADRLKAVDVGARGGLPSQWQRFTQYIEFDAFEPDADACAAEKAVAQPNQNWFPVALGGHTGLAKLYVLKKPSGSSLYPPNPVVNDAYAPNGYGALASVIDVPVMTFSDFLAKYQRPRPNLIKLDTQGSELDILRALKDDDWSDLLAVQVEVEFIPYYLEQPLFHEVDQFMRSKGFALYDLLGQRMFRVREDREIYYLEKHLNISKRRPDISRRMVAGDAFYLRPPEEVLASRERTGIAKLFVALLMYRFLDEALWLAEEAERQGIISAEEARSLIGEVKAVAPAPRLVQRADLIGRLARKWTRLTGIGRARKAEFWLDRKWDA